MGFRQDVTLRCPLCDKGNIPVTIFPRSVKFKTGTWGGSKPGRIENAESGIIRIKECPVCKVSDKEISKKWKETGIGNYS